MIVESVKLEDAKEILSIYAPYVRDTFVSLETEVPNEEDFEKRVKDISSEYPFYVCRDNGKVIGYAYATRYRVRGGYRFTVECSVYVSKDVHRRGIGTMLYEALFEELKKRGFHTALVVIVLPNLDSVAFHKALGFEEVGRFKEVGNKFDKWLDVAWLEKKL